MKRFRSTLSMLLALLMLCSLNSILASAASTTTEEDYSAALMSLADHNEEFYLKQYESIAAYNQLIDSFALDNAEYSLSSNSAYPDYYGGAYIDDVTGELIVLVTELSTARSQIPNISNEVRSAIRFQKCNISYNEIITAVNTITDSIDTFRNLGIIIDFVGDDILNGEVIVDVQNLTEEKEQAIMDQIDFEFIHFRNSDGFSTEESVGAGTHIISMDNSGSSTLGFAARMGGMTGFIIAGHSGDYVGESFKTTLNSTLGSVVATAYRDGSTADAAFVSASSAVTATNDFRTYGEITSATTSILPVNTTIHMYGATYGLRSGRITNTISSITTSNGYTIRQCCGVDYQSAGGDSGGPVVLYNGNDEYTLCGIHVGSSLTSKVFSPYKNIMNELSVVCMTS